MINGSRRLRIANGSGVQVSDVNQLVDRFFEARKMMGQMGGMGLPGHARKRQRDQVVEEHAQGQEGQGRRPRPDPAAHAGRLPGRPARRHGRAGCPAGPMLSQLPPGMEMPDLSKLKLPKQ